MTTVLLTESTYIFIFSQINFTFQRYKNLIISFIKKYFVQHLCKLYQNIPLYVQHVSVFVTWRALPIYTSVHPVWTNQNHIYWKHYNVNICIVLKKNFCLICLKKIYGIVLERLIWRECQECWKHHHNYKIFPDLNIDSFPL